MWHMVAIPDQEWIELAFSFSQGCRTQKDLDSAAEPRRKCNKKLHTKFSSQAVLETC